MLWACIDCMTRYAAGLAACPQCGGTRYREAPGGDVVEGAPVLPVAAEPELAGDAPKTKKTKAAEQMPTAPEQA